MSFGDDPRFEIESYPCSCGGEITKDSKSHYWSCSKCNFKRLILTVRKGEQNENNNRTIDSESVKD